MKILAFDPGGTTGIALLDCHRMPLKDINKVTSWQHGPQEHHAALWETLWQINADVIVCERFVYRQLNKVSLEAPEYIGVINLWIQETGIQLVMQTPTQAKNLWTDKKLKDLQLYKTGMPHANDAMRHLLYYVTVNRKDYYFVNHLPA